jgi:hypothetical protein
MCQTEREYIEGEREAEIKRVKTKVGRIHPVIGHKVP